MFDLRIAGGRIVAIDLIFDPADVSTIEVVLLDD